MPHCLPVNNIIVSVAPLLLWSTKEGGTYEMLWNSEQKMKELPHILPGGHSKMTSLDGWY